MGSGTTAKRCNVRVAAARPKALPMTNGRTIGKLALADATQVLIVQYHGSRGSAEARDCDPDRVVAL
jgi:hypothetical protein